MITFVLVLDIQMRYSWKQVAESVPRTHGRAFTTLDAFTYIQSSGLVPLSEYVARSHTKKMEYHIAREWKRTVKIRAYQWLTPGDEDMLKVAVALIGPISVSIKATDSFFFYKSGVFYDTDCRRKAQVMINHAVVLVGYGSDPAGGDYWIIHNSWGSHWGENGFARMARNAILNCEIDSFALYPIL